MKRIFMLSRQLLFSQGVESLLIEQPGLEIVGRESDVDKAMEQIGTLRPDVVILDSQDLESAPSSLITLILKESPGSRVITLNLANDQVRVYHGEQYSAQSVDDLLEVMNEETTGHGQITWQEWTTLAEERAQVYGFHAAIYYQEIDDTLIKNLVEGSTSWISSLERGEDLTGDLREGVHALERFLRGLSNRSLDATRAELAEEYAHLLQSGRPGEHSIPACEAMYVKISPECEASVSSVVAQTYAAAGLSLPVQRQVQPDFIARELDFMYHLCIGEANAWKERNRCAALRYQEFERAFLKDHLARWVPRFCDSMLRQTDHDFYRGIACLTKGFILIEAYRVADLMEWVSPPEELR